MQANAAIFTVQGAALNKVADRKIRKEMTEKRDTYNQIQELTQIIKNRGR